MAKKRTKADKLQRNIERLARRDEAHREKSALSDKPAGVAKAAAHPARDATKE